MDVEFGKSIFSLDIIKKAAYRFTDKAVFDFVEGDGVFICKIQPREKVNDDLNELVLAFKSEVLDQDLRSKIASESEPIRNLILAHTFSNTGIKGE